MKARQTIRQRESLASYERRVSRRDAERERALMGETLAAFHARENAKPPTLAEIYRTHPRARCPWTPSLLDWKPRRRKARAA